MIDEHGEKNDVYRLKREGRGDDTKRNGTKQKGKGREGKGATQERRRSEATYNRIDRRTAYFMYLTAYLVLFEIKLLSFCLEIF